MMRWMVILLICCALLPASAIAEEPAGIARAQLKALAARIAAEEGVSPSLFDALVTRESNYHVDALSPKGAMSLAQLMPGTAIALGLTEDQFFDPEANLRGGARYLKGLLDTTGDVSKALASYNAGPARVKDRSYEDWPGETRRFVSAILGQLSLASRPRRLIGSISSMPGPEADSGASGAAQAAPVAENDLSEAPPTETRAASGAVDITNFRSLTKGATL